MDDHGALNGGAGRETGTPQTHRDTLNQIITTQGRPAKLESLF